MIDIEYEHADQSLKTGIYVPMALDRLLIGMSRRNRSVDGLGCIRSVSVGIRWARMLMAILGRSLIRLVRSVRVRGLCLCRRGRKNVGCTGWYVVKISMSTLGVHPASNSLHNLRCKHNTDEHNFNHPLKCKKCNCYGFESNFACLTCDGLWEHHEVLY